MKRITPPDPVAAASSERAQDDKSRIQSIGKMMDILECFSTVHRHRTLAQVAEAAGLQRHTAKRMITALREIGFIDQDARNGRYRLGIRQYELGHPGLATQDQILAALSCY